MKTTKQYLSIACVFALSICMPLSAQDETATKQQAYGQALYERTCALVDDSDNSTQEAVDLLVQKIIADEAIYDLLSLGQDDGYTVVELFEFAQKIAQDNEDQEVVQVLESVKEEVSKSWLSKNPIVLLAVAASGLMSYLYWDSLKPLLSSCLESLGITEPSVVNPPVVNPVVNPPVDPVVNPVVNPPVDPVVPEKAPLTPEEEATLARAIAALSSGATSVLDPEKEAELEKMDREEVAKYLAAFKEQEAAKLAAGQVTGDQVRETVIENLKDANQANVEALVEKELEESKHSSLLQKIEHKIEHVVHRKKPKNSKRSVGPMSEQSGRVGTATLDEESSAIIEDFYQESLNDQPDHLKQPETETQTDAAVQVEAEAIKTEVPTEVDAQVSAANLALKKLAEETVAQQNENSLGAGCCRVIGKYGYVEVLSEESKTTTEAALPEDSPTPEEEISSSDDLSNESSSEEHDASPENDSVVAEENTQQVAQDGTENPVVTEENTEVVPVVSEQVADNTQQSTAQADAQVDTNASVLQESQQPATETENKSEFTLEDIVQVASDTIIAAADAEELDPNNLI